jgi:hypothetical protein
MCGASTPNKTKTKMKTTLTKAAAAGLTALVIGNAAAQESVSKPVGYETLALTSGFNYVGLRLHEATLASGEAADVVGTTVTLPDGLGASLVPGAVHIFEVTSGDAAGAVTIFTPADNSDTVTLADDLSDNFFGGDTFSIRPSATLASVFGADNSAGLDAGFFAPGGDQIWIPEGAGFVKYYYDSGTATWANFETGAAVDGNTVPLVYTDGFIVVDTGETESLVISGSVKLGATSLALTGSGSFNYFSSIYPVGATLASFFGASNESGLNGGFFAPGGDQIWTPVAAGFEKFYYDDGLATWASFDTGAAVDPATVELPSGFIVVNDATDNPVLGSAPSFYADL